MCKRERSWKYCVIAQKPAFVHHFWTPEHLLEYCGGLDGEKIIIPRVLGLAGWDCLTVAQSVSKGRSELMSLWAPGETIWQPTVSLLASCFPYLRIQSCTHKYTTYIWEMFTRDVGLLLNMQYSWFLSHSVFVCECMRYWICRLYWVTRDVIISWKVTR